MPYSDLAIKSVPASFEYATSSIIYRSLYEENAFMSAMKKKHGTHVFTVLQSVVYSKHDKVHILFKMHYVSRDKTFPILPAVHIIVKC